MCSQSAQKLFSDKFNQKNEWNFITDQMWAVFQQEHTIMKKLIIMMF